MKYIGFANAGKEEIKIVKPIGTDLIIEIENKIDGREPDIAVYRFTSTYEILEFIESLKSVCDEIDEI